MTALMLASQSGKTDLVQKLLDLGADPNATNKAGQTALHLATTIGAPQKKKSKFGGFAKMLGGAALSGGLGALSDKGGFASHLLGGGNIDSLLGGNLQGLLSGNAFQPHRQVGLERHHRHRAARATSNPTALSVCRICSAAASSMRAAGQSDRRRERLQLRCASVP
jgi:hypothetical protein